MKTTELLKQYEWSEFERVVVLSPHLDDAALSCGGLLHALQGRAAALVVSVCCGNPPRIVAADGSSRAQTRRGHVSPRYRRREDIAAMHSVNADFVHLSFADGIYRRSPLTGMLIYRNAREHWTSPRVDDMAHVEELFLVLRRICLDLGRILLVSPMGIGHHVDHQIVAQVAVRLAAAGVALLFYEDFPYVVDPRVGRGDDDDPLSALARLRMIPAERFALPFGAAAKAALLRHYATQVPALFGDDAGMQASLTTRRFAGAPVEFYWRAFPMAGPGATQEVQSAE